MQHAFRATWPYRLQNRLKFRALTAKTPGSRGYSDQHLGDGLSTHTGVTRPFAGKTAVISGGSSGIGLATAELLAARGAAVVIGHFRGDPHDPAPSIERIQARGGTAVAHELDVSDDTSTARFVNFAHESFGQVDFAVGSAGILRKASLSELDEPEWRRVLDVDLGGIYRLFRYASERMPSGGALVSVSSISGGVYGWADHAHYCAAKAGILGLTRACAIELASRGIRANTVIPGVVESPQSLDEANSLGPAGLRRAARNIPLGRVGQPEEIAKVIAFALSSEASYLTAQELVVDGGLTRVQS